LRTLGLLLRQPQARRFKRGNGKWFPRGLSSDRPRANGDAAIDAEDKQINRKLKSICRGC
jgi:hypothetical protein